MATALAITVPGYLCCYCDEIDALNLCHALHLYGIEAEMRENRRYPRPDPRYHNWVSWSVWLKDARDLDRAVEFKRGLYATLAIKGDASAFADGVIAGSQMRHPGIKQPLIEEGDLRKRYALTAGTS